MQTAAIALIVVLLVGMACGLEITWALGLSCIVAVLLDPKLTFVVIAQRIFANSNSFSMLAIPAFMLAGDVMSKGGLSKRLVAFADSLVGWISGGISLVSIVACTFFAAISGSSVATTAAIGGLMYPEMVKRGYPESYAAAVQAIGGTLGIVIPPSIVLVIYGNITGTDVGALLMAGILPGVVCSIFLCLYAYYKAKKCGFPKSDKFSFKRFLVSFKDAVWALIMPVIILGGIYAGIFTPTESAVVAVVYGLIVCLAVYREISMKTIWEIVENTAEGTANLMILVVTAQMFGWLISYYQIPQAVTNFMLAFVSNKYMFWGDHHHPSDDLRHVPGSWSNKPDPRPDPCADRCCIWNRSGTVRTCLRISSCNGTGDTAFRNLYVCGMRNQQTVRWSGVKASGSVRCSRDPLRNLICTCSGNFTAAPVDHRVTWNKPIIDKTKLFRKRRMNYG